MAKYPLWTQEEHDYLESLVGNYPFRQVVLKYQSKAKKMGWPYRSSTSIKVRTSRHIGTRKAIDQNFTYHTLADILGYNRYRVREWVRSGKLEVERVGKLTKVTKKSLQSFAEKYPRLLSDADEIGLRFLFGDDKAQGLMDLPSAISKEKKVYCKRTGIVYPSINAAAKANYMNKATVRRRAHIGNDFCFLGEGQ